MMLRETLIFDLDGTLVDSLPGIAEALNLTLKAAGLPTHPEPSIRRFIGNGLETTVRRACPVDHNDDATVTRLVADFQKSYSHTWQHGTHVFPGMRELLTELHNHGVSLAVLTNKSHEFAVEMMTGIFPEIPFASVLGLTPGMPPKPDPSGALEIAHDLGIAPAQCRIIGDSTMDIETAKLAGMQSCAVTWGYHDADHLVTTNPDHVVSDVPALRKWLMQTGVLRKAND